MSDSSQKRVGEILEKLTNAYDEFTLETEKSLLRWQTDPGDEEMVDVFVRYQQEHGDLRDLIVEMKVPFNGNGDAYSYALVEELVRQHEEIKPILAAEEKMDMGWTCPDLNAAQNLTAYLISVLDSFQNYYKALTNFLGLVLLPRAIKDTAAFAKWIETLLQCHPPKSLRFVVLDPIATPMLDELAESKPDQIHTFPLQLDYPGMLEALARGEADPKAPDAQFRVLFVKLSERAKAQDIDGAEQIAGQALAIAEAHNWYPMQVVVCSVLGAAHLQLRNFESALHKYRTATDISRAAKAAEDPAGAKMEVQSLFAEGATLVAMGNYEQAAEAYLETAPLAEALADPFLTMEAWRMAAYCYEVKKDYAEAIRYSERALEAGHELPEDQRAQSTLPYVGDALIRVIRTAKKKVDLFHVAGEFPDETDIHEKIAALLGDDWQDSVVTEQAGADQP